MSVSCNVCSHNDELHLVADGYSECAACEADDLEPVCEYVGKPDPLED